jgi:hypothetical protein
VLERLDLLRHTILEHFEVGGLQTIHDPAVSRWVDVDADEVRADADRLLGLSRQAVKKDYGGGKTAPEERHADGAAHD